jgi:hypothetical protein
MNNKEVITKEIQAMAARAVKSWKNQGADIDYTSTEDVDLCAYSLYFVETIASEEYEEFEYNEVLEIFRDAAFKESRKE